MEFHFVACEICIRTRIVLQSRDARANEESHEPQSDAVRFLKISLVFCAKSNHFAHVHFVEGRQHCSVVLSADKSFRNSLTQASHLFATNASSPWHGCLYMSSTSTFCSSFNINFHHTPRWAAAFKRAGINPFVSGHFFRNSRNARW